MPEHDYYAHSDVELVSDDELDDIVRRSKTLIEQGGYSVDQAAYYFGVSAMALYDNINITQSLQVRH